MPRSGISVIGLTLLAAALLTACASVPRDIDPPKISIVNLTPKDLTLFEQRFDVQLRIQNPNDTDLGINGMRFDIEINDREFANGMSGQKVTVPRLGSEVMNVEVSTGLGNMLKQVQGLNASGSAAVRYRVKGMAFVESPSKFKLPFDEKGEISLAPESAVTKP